MSRKRKNRKSKQRRKQIRQVRAGVQSQARPAGAGPASSPAPSRPTESLTQLPSLWSVKTLVCLAALGAAVVYAYLPTVQWFVEAWKTEPDYSHGFVVIPLAMLILHRRLDWFPGIRQKTSRWGLFLILLSIAMRLAGRMVYADFLDGWSIVPLVCGIVWYLWGARAMRWALPAIAFLFLMIPMPYQAESLLSWKLQGVATQLSTILLRVFGQPAVSEGHIVWLHGERLLVEQACSGLRIFVGVGALAYFWAVISDRSWIDRVVILLAAIPIAVLANSLRITAIGLLYQWITSEKHRVLLHDLCGVAMIPLAFLLLWLVKIYWERLYRPVTRLTARDFLSSSVRLNPE